MALNSTEITMSLVNQALSTNYSKLSELCTSDQINIWSRWKPIANNADTLTEKILKDSTYGLTIYRANNVNNLYNNVVNNNNLGYNYNPPRGGAASPYRLGDFRNYEHTAPFPIECSYNNGDTVEAGGATDTNVESYRKTLMGIESAAPDEGVTFPYLTANDLFVALDDFGNQIELKRGALVTDGTNTYWSTDYIPWAEQNWKKFSGEVTVFEFLTNVDNNIENVYTANANDVFFALPDPIRVINVDRTDIPAGSRLLWAEYDVLEYADNTNAQVNYKFRLSAVGDTYSGGTIDNLFCGICTDNKGIDIIINKRLETSNITIDKEGTSAWYEGTLRSRADENGNYPSQVYFCIWYNNTLQHTTMPMQQVIDPYNEETENVQT